jgi:dienelactone hydrolase
MLHPTKLLALSLAVAALPGGAAAALKTQEIDYQAGDTPLQGYVAFDDAAKGKRPGVLVVHEWWGHNEHARKQAERLAKAGYVALAVDMYGKGKLAKHPDDAKAFMTEATKDPETVRARFDAALKLLKEQPQVDPGKIAAFGYCMGGTMALAMAKSGHPDLDAVAAFHAGPPPGPPPEKGTVMARMLVLAGGADPFIPKEKLAAFEKDMKAAGAKLKVVTYPQVKHSFTNPAADSAGMEALAYDAKTDRKSWDEAMKLLKATFAKK